LFGQGPADSDPNAIVRARFGLIDNFNADATRPTANIPADPAPAAGNPSVDFTVTLADNTTVSANSLAPSYVPVPLSDAPFAPATLLSTNPTTDAPTITATYRLTAPGGAWDSTDNGNYTFA